MIRLSHDYVRSIALVSDLHVLAEHGLCPEGFVGRQGGDRSASMNAGQRKLLEYWKDFTRIMRDEMKIDSVFIIGDAIAGINPKECGLMMMTTDINEQVEAAIKLLYPLCKNKRVGVWSGTAYHESRDVRVHEYIAQALNGTFFGPIAILQIEPSKKVVNIAHRSTEAVMYPETAIGRDIMSAKQAEALGQIPKTHAIIRGHYHHYIETHRHDMHYISLPCWQAYVPYDKAIRWYFKYQPDIGGAVMLIDDKDRLRFFHFLYPTPHISDKVRGFPI